MTRLKIPITGAVLREKVGSQRRALQPGEVFEHPDDARAKRLIEIGVAIATKEPITGAEGVKAPAPGKKTEPPKTAEEQIAELREELEGLKVAELRTRAGKAEVDHEGLTKAELVSAILNVELEKIL
jgi:hypothetical protein